MNLETSVTRSDAFAPNKAVHYRMSPANLPALAVARPDVVVLANNHVLDFGRRGLQDTLDALSGAGLRASGAGRDVRRARRPAAIALDDGRRVWVFSFGMVSSGIPLDWAATGDRAGVDILPAPSDATAATITDQVRQVKRPGDLVVASIHWGSNWGYHIRKEQIHFAHRLIDGGVDILHGHSSHHPRPVEVYRDRLILYGCGDLINDYEGIGSHEKYRDDLRLLYLASLQPDTGTLVGLRMVPLQARQMRLHHASRADAVRLRAILGRVSRDFGSRIDTAPDGTVTVRRP
jgi:poly-gamma-glutamate synthesis protein (capsule biosynthesis protein)